jgi:hypothetical protein
MKVIQETDSLLLLLDPDQPVKADVHFEVYIIFDSRSNHCHLISDERWNNMYYASSYRGTM